MKKIPTKKLNPVIVKTMRMKGSEPRVLTMLYTV